MTTPPTITLKAARLLLDASLNLQEAAAHLRNNRPCAAIDAMNEARALQREAEAALTNNESRDPVLEQFNRAHPRKEAA